MSKMSKAVLLTLCVLCVLKDVSSFDLHTLLSQGTSGIKAMMTPELLNKMKAMLPSGTGSPADIHEIERLLSKLRPAQGRFDPAMLELLASMDASKRINYASSTPRSRTGKSTSSATPHLEILNSPEDSVPSTTLHSYTTEGRPKFSSKFRLEDQRDPPVDTTSSMGIDHVIDPNLRNHRLYDVDQEQRERYENYENFTTIDQLEDLIADETSPQVVVSIPKSPKNKLSPGKNRGKLRDSNKRKRPPNEEVPATTSFEELISLEATEENESMAHEREALKRASTEKTVVYSHSMTGPSSERPYGTTMGFRPSPVDLSAPMYSYDHEHNIDDYYVPQSKPKLKLKHPRRPHAHRKSSSSSRPEHDHNKFDDSFHYDDDYEKEQPDYQNVVHYLKLQGQGQPILRSTTPHGHTGHEGYEQQHSIPQPLPPPPPPRQLHVNILNPNVKHDRILTPADMSTPMHSPIPTQPLIQPNGPLYPQQYNRYVPAASENVYNDVHPSHYNNFYQQQQQQQQPMHSPSGTDLTYSAGQNYYQSNHGHGGEGHGHQQQQHHGHDHHHQGYSSGSHHYPHHVEDSSSWSSTFLILGGLIALSAAIAFLLPSFITGAPPAGGKDGVDKNSSSDNNDLWAEIKGLYNDIMNLARGDYSQFHKYNDRNLPKINIIEVEEEEEEKKQGHKKPVSHRNRNKGQNSFNKRVGGPAYHEDESSEEHSTDFSASPAEEHDGPEEDEENSPESLHPGTPEHHMELKERPKKKRVVDKDSLAYAIYGKGGVASKSKYSYDFANAFNQTLNAWEKVPLITN